MSQNQKLRVVHHWTAILSKFNLIKLLDKHLEHKVKITLRRGNLKKSAKFQKRRALLNPQKSELHRQLACTYARMDRVDLAVAHYQYCLSRHQNAPILRSANFLERQKRAKHRGMPSVFINSIPKSASEFIVTRLSEGFDLPRCRLSARYIEPEPIPLACDTFLSGGCVCKEHVDVNSRIAKFLLRNGIKKFIFHTRDPRSIVVSRLRGIEKSITENDFDDYDKVGHYNWLVHSRAIPSEFRHWSQSQRIDYMIQSRLPKVIKKIQMWVDLENNKSQDFDLFITTYEDFVTNPEVFFEKVLSFYDLPSCDFDFSKLRVKPDVNELNFRQGKPDGFKEVFSNRQREMAFDLMPDHFRSYFQYEP